LPVEGRLIVVSGGGWGVGDLAGAVSAALQAQPDATVLCLCGRNDELRARLAKRFPQEPRLRLMGFTDRMGDVLAAGDALIHSSAGLTVLEAIIRGCPVISYGFGYGHVRASNAALERFGLAQVARHEHDLAPAIERALAQHPEPDPTFATRPSTAWLIMNDERRTRPIPAWRLRSARVATSAVAVAAVGSWALTTGASYSFVSHFAHIKPVTAVQTAAPEVGLLINAPSQEVRGLAGQLSAEGVRASFTYERAPSAAVLTVLRAGQDQVVPRLPTGGLVRWLGTRGQLHRLLRQFGYSHHFWYATRGPSLGQWLLAHGAGGRPVAGAVRVDDRDDTLGRLRPGEVIEVNVAGAGQLATFVTELRQQLVALHLTAVPVSQLMQDAGQSA
jgi:hypothetical protein